MAAVQVAKALPTREEIPAEHRWRLEDIFETNDQWEQEFREVKEALPKVASYQGRLGSSAATLLELLRLRDEVSQKVERLFVYARMRKDEQSTNTAAQALADRATALMVETSRALSYVVPEILAIPSETLEGFVASEPGLQLYRHALDEIARMRPHTLTASEEQLLAMAGEMGQAPRNIFDMIDDADLRFPTIRDENGEEIELSKGRYARLLEGRNRRVRQEAFEKFYEPYFQLKNTLAATYNASLKKDIFFARARRFPSALEAALYPDAVPLEVYTNLIQTVREHLPLLHRYLRLRKKLLNLDELHVYDLYVPLVADLKIEVPYEEAVQWVLDGLAPLGEEYRKTVSDAIRSRWIDVYETKGKTSGAYSWGAYGTHPYILLNYQGRLGDVFTLAHEMGHAMHSFFSDREQPYVYAQYTIFVAEVASTLNELLLTHHLLQKTGDPKQRMYLLNHYLDEFRGTVFRQTMFAEFEKATHEKVEAGEALTVDELNQMYRKLTADYYGDAVVLDPQIEMEWARIPHFYRAFYVYKYATGFSAAAALSRRILEEGQPAVERYQSFLKSGGSDYPINLLKKAGVDMTSPEPVRQALAAFEQALDQLEELAGA